MTMKCNRIGSTAYSQTGEGPTVVLVHGLGLNQQMWQWQLPALQENYRVVTYDLLGHGESKKPSGSFSMPQMVEQLDNLLIDLDIDRCALIGFSLGGLIVQAYTLAHPEKVQALGILNAAHARTPEQREGILERVAQCRSAGPGATVSDALARWFSAAFADQNESVLAQVREWVLANDPDVYPEAYQLLANGDIGLEESISAIECPTLVMTADEDYGNSAEMAQHMATRIPNSQLEILTGLRHMALAEDPQQVNQLLLDFLEKTLVS